MPIVFINMDWDGGLGNGTSGEGSECSGCKPVYRENGSYYGPVAIGESEEDIGDAGLLVLVADINK